MSHVCQQDATPHVDDPALAACCQREETEHKHAQKLKEALLSYDRTTARVQQRKEIVVPLVNEKVCQSKQPVSYAMDEEYDSADSDEEMEEIYAARRIELQRKHQQMLQCAAQGYGIVARVDLCDFLNNISRDDQVLAIVTDTSPLYPTMEQLILSTAKKYLGTRFYLSVAASTESLTSRLLDTSIRVPCIAAYRDKKLVHQMSLRISSDVDIAVYWEAQVLQWLQMCHVLNLDRAVSHVQEERMDIEKDQDTSNESGYDCGVENCRLRFSYEHEHVAPSDISKQEISAWRS
uniref:Uncharacterized protein AlNc14C137G7136 n=1 Tax=Albugo laibachii Nc14 TaxID=890382 RepID=F0WKU7_9STRA|nr:conserved hypothetical protein [Albugo laibachii Nc14]|eukprot:CCA21904.1 conserved hypothetical protein [Albugo laibachii Nc14]